MTEAREYPFPKIRGAVCGESRLLLLVLGLCVGGAQLRLRHDWTSGEVHSPTAMLIARHQAQCTEFVYYYQQNNLGMGSDIHTWTQALCNSMQANASLLETEKSWVWNDNSFCKNSHAGLGCYFNKHKYCPDSVPFPPSKAYPGDIIKANRDLSSCPSLISDDASRQEWRRAAVEYLFSNVSSRLVSEVEAEIVPIFGGAIPDDLITVHIRWGDKKGEMQLVTQAEYVAAIEAIAQKHSLTPKVFVTTESRTAITALNQYISKHKTGWTVYHYAPSVYDDHVHQGKTPSPMKMASETGGSLGKASLISLLLAMEARYYVLTSGSNWSRLIDELRRNHIDPLCGNCTHMVDLREGRIAHNW